MAERSTAAVDVADSGESEGKTLSDRTDATNDGATHGDGPQDTAPEAEEGGAEDSAMRAESSDTAEPNDGPEAAEHPDTPVEDGAPSDDRAENPPEAVAEDASIGSTQPTEAEPSTSLDADADAQPSASGEAQVPEDTAEEPEPPGGEQEAAAPELHSGHKLARRYRLEECVTRLDGFSSWRAVDEKLRRAVGVHVLPAAHPRARKVLAAARSAALLGDPRFVQVLDAVEEGELVYVVHEWLVDAVPLNDLLLTAPLEPHEAYQLVSQLSQGMAAAHREGLAHLRLSPSCVLRTGVGQYRIRGLAVNAALRGVTSEEPSRTDTEAVGALLYAALTQRWPYEKDAYGLSGVGGLAGGTLIAPDQVRAGVHRGLSALAMRALVNDGATPSRQDQPCATPDELAKAVAELPRIRPPEPAYQPPAAYVRRQSNAVPPGTPATGTEPPAPPALPGRTGKALKWGVSALLIAALGLGSWQVADALLKGDTSNEKPAPAPTKETDPTGEPIKVAGVEDFDPESADGQENPEDVDDAVDDDPTTYWPTSKYYGQPNFGNLKSGVGLILDLGKLQQVSEVQVDFLGTTRAEIHAAPRSATGMPTSLGGFEKVSGGTGEKLKLKAKKPVRTQYVLLWLTKLPLSEDGNYRGRVAEVRVLS
ncbi:hypothetical protein [Streptomyces sulphureus]|uniref:hypothetical protein n=1 Tax=Streptomyces sulphureus TaxID=47758 RepID=UPI0003652B0F|nr:hypothetical protein [Streptomyces sulphureus]